MDETRPYAKQAEAAARLGEMVERGDLSQQDAQQTMTFVFAEARRVAPHLDPRGIRMRLAWSAGDGATAEMLARIRREKALTHALVAVAVEGFSRRLPDPVIRKAVTRAAIDIGAPAALIDPAIGRGRWLQRNGQART